MIFMGTINSLGIITICHHSSQFSMSIFEQIALIFLLKDINLRDQILLLTFFDVLYLKNILSHSDISMHY